MDSTSQSVPENWAVRFFTIWTGQAFSLLGSALVQFALVWWLTRETGSATVLATATLVALLPQIVLGPFAGALVDRWNRRVIMIVADTSIALAATAASAASAALPPFARISRPAAVASGWDVATMPLRP